MSDPSIAVDPYAQPGFAKGTTQLQVAAPPGGGVTINPDGSATFDLSSLGPSTPQMGGHFQNLAEVLPPGRLAQIAHDLLDAIQIDRDARKKRDDQYDEGMKRTGLGDDAPGGAQFPGASRAVHPVLTEAAVDFAARIMNEMMPPDGPVKAKTIGEPTMDKDDKAERVARYMNLQLTELMPNVYHEMEMGFTQMPLGGAFYTKFVFDDSGLNVIAIPIDKVIRPWSDGSIYAQPRITHEQETDRYEYIQNVNRGLWVDVLNPDVSSDIPEQTKTQTSNDRVVGRVTPPPENIDKVRRVYETSMMMPLYDDEDEQIEPYLVTVDEQTRKILSIYRNWRENDPNKQRLDFLTEWPFWPWRGGYPIGMTHMIGGLSGAATGAMRALLDAAFLNTVQTGVRLKGGATAGGQNIRAQPAQTTEVQGSLAQNDVRATYLPLPFPPPSPVLFELLGFLVDAARGVVRTTFDEYDKFTGNTPVGTANMFIQQGLTNLGAVHGRLHRSMRRFLKQLWEINARTVSNVETQDDFGELIVNAEDFQGPLNVVPVSDPRIFSDMQRASLGQMLVQRSTMLPQLYDLRKTELYFLRQMKVPNPDQFLQPQAQPVQQNAVAENAAASQGLPIKAFPGQDHEAHLLTHIVYMDSPLFGSNPTIAKKFLPGMLDHIGEHLALWYSNAMLESANAALRIKTGRMDLTIESLSSPIYEAPLDRLLAELIPVVMKHAQSSLKTIPAIVQRAQDLMKSLIPPPMMDPSVVAAQDVQRQQKKDEDDTNLKMIELQQKDTAQQNKDQLAETTANQKHAVDIAKIAAQREDASRKSDLGAAQVAATQQASADRVRSTEDTNQSREQIANDQNASREQIAAASDQSRENVAQISADAQIERTKMETASAEEIAAKQIKAQGSSRFSTGSSLKK